MSRWIKISSDAFNLELMNNVGGENKILRQRKLLPDAISESQGKGTDANIVVEFRSLGTFDDESVRFENVRFGKVSRIVHDRCQ